MVTLPLRAAPLCQGPHRRGPHRRGPHLRGPHHNAKGHTIATGATLPRAELSTAVLGDTLRSSEALGAQRGKRVPSNLDLTFRDDLISYSQNIIESQLIPFTLLHFYGIILAQ